MKAVIKFQMKNGIKGSGFFGPMSRGFFERSCGKGLMKDHDNASSTKEKDDHKNASSTNDHWTATSSQKLPGGPGQSWTSDGHGDGHDGHNGHDD